jgi:hypothetical protein
MLALKEKLEVVRAWRESGLSQESFCQGHPAAPAPRTLRAWAALETHPDDVLRQTRNALDKLFDVVWDLLDAIEAARAGAQAAAASCHSAADTEEASEDVAEAIPNEEQAVVATEVAEPVAPESAPPPSALVKRQGKRTAFWADLAAPHAADPSTPAAAASRPAESPLIPRRASPPPPGATAAATCRSTCHLATLTWRRCESGGAGAAHWLGAQGHDCDYARYVSSGPRVPSLSLGRSSSPLRLGPLEATHPGATDAAP